MQPNPSPIAADVIQRTLPPTPPTPTTTHTRTQRHGGQCAVVPGTLQEMSAWRFETTNSPHRARWMRSASIDGSAKSSYENKSDKRVPLTVARHAKRHAEGATSGQFPADRAHHECQMQEHHHPHSCTHLSVGRQCRTHDKCTKEPRCLSCVRVATLGHFELPMKNRTIA
jgi:hypothetical protein